MSLKNAGVAHWQSASSKLEVWVDPHRPRFANAFGLKRRYFKKASPSRVCKYATTARFFVSAFIPIIAAKQGS